MNLYKNYILSLPLALLLCLVVFAMSCTDNDFIDETTKGVYSSVSIKIKMPQTTTISTPTRAGVVDFNQTADINVFITNGSSNSSTIVQRMYFKFSEITPGQQIAGTTITYDDVIMNGENVREFKLKFQPEWFAQQEVSLKNCFIYAVVKWGSAIGGNVQNLEQLKSLRTTSLNNSGILLAPNVMFGYSIDDGSEPLPGGKPGEMVRKLKINLERTAAMVTVVVDGSKLNRNICLSNFAISLHNVPTDCSIGKDNTTTSKNIAANGEYKESQSLNWNPIVGTESNKSCGRKTWETYKNLAGKHYIDADNAKPEEDNYRLINPLFLFENIHGENFGAEETDQRYKRPAGVDRNENAINQAEQTKTCSYLKVTAHYEKVDDNGNSLISGNVAYNFFLGADILKNFDVKGNHYYQVTLTLSGNAVTEGGQIDKDGNLKPNPDEATWRVDTDLSTASFLTGDINLNASGEFFYVDVAASDQDWKVTAKGDCLFIWVYGSSYGSDPTWVSAAYNTVVKPFDNSGRLLFYAQQGLSEYDEYPLGKNTYRETELILTPSGGGASSSITIRQYRQITFTVSATKYPHIKDIFGAESMTFNLDRIDREARPWGFENQKLEMNHEDGFENTYYLFKPETEGGKHRKFATRYLPFGVETRPNHQTGNKYNPDESVIKDGGSAMMYGALVYENQDNSSPQVSPEEIMNRDFPTIDKNQDWENKKWYWTIPSIEAWQIIEKEKGQLDENFPIKDWFPYWTSDAVTTNTTSGIGSGGTTHSFAYQFGRGLHSITKEGQYPLDMRFDRRDRLRFRLISVRPNQLPISNN